MKIIHLWECLCVYCLSFQILVECYEKLLFHQFCIIYICLQTTYAKFHLHRITRLEGLGVQEATFVNGHTFSPVVQHLYIFLNRKGYSFVYFLLLTFMALIAINCHKGYSLV